MQLTKNIAEIKSARLPILFSAAILLTTSGCGKNATQHMGNVCFTSKEKGDEKFNSTSSRSSEESEKDEVLHICYGLYENELKEVDPKILWANVKCELSKLVRSSNKKK